MCIGQGVWESKPPLTNGFPRKERGLICGGCCWAWLWGIVLGNCVRCVFGHANTVCGARLPINRTNKERECREQAQQACKHGVQVRWQLAKAVAKKAMQRKITIARQKGNGAVCRNLFATHCALTCCSACSIACRCASHMLPKKSYCKSYAVAFGKQSALGFMVSIRLLLHSVRWVGWLNQMCSIAFIR